MSKAEERALQEYPKSTPTFIVPNNILLRDAYIKGYRQAEKDLELTVEDLQLICEIEFSICYYEYKDKKFPPREQIYKEILRRFKERKNEG